MLGVIGVRRKARGSASPWAPHCPLLWSPEEAPTGSLSSGHPWVRSTRKARSAAPLPVTRCWR